MKAKGQKSYSNKASERKTKVFDAALPSPKNLQDSILSPNKSISSCERTKKKNKFKEAIDHHLGAIQRSFLKQFSDRWFYFRENSSSRQQQYVNDDSGQDIRQRNNKS